MAEIKNAARLVMATRLITDVVKEETDAAKVVARQLMEDSGAERVRVADEAGNNLGAVTLSNGRTTARVTDQKAFATWVAKKYPTEITVAINPAFQKRLLDAATAAGDPVDGLASDGELIPGVEIRQGDPYLTVRPTDEARDRMRTMLANSGLLALAAGDEGDGEVAGDAQE